MGSSRNPLNRDAVSNLTGAAAPVFLGGVMYGLFVIFAVCGAFWILFR